MKINRLSGLGFLMFFIHPLSGFIISLLNFKSKASMLVYIMFAALFGYAISFNNSSADSYRYAIAFKNFDNTLDYSEIVEMYRRGELRDLYRLLLFYFTSLFTSNPKIMYAIAGLIYGVFSYFSLKIFIKETKVAVNLKSIILFVIFFTFVPITNINGFRFHTGAVILFVSIYNFWVYNRLLWIFGVLITPYFHYGFFLIIPIIITYKFISILFYDKYRVSKNLYYLFLVVYVLSWFLKTNTIDLSFVTQSEVISGEVANRVDFINSSNVTDIVEKRKDNSLFLSVQKYFDFLIKLFVLVAIHKIRDILERNNFQDLYLNKLFTFTLLFYVFAFIAVSFPSGGRFLVFAHMFLFIVIGRIVGMCEDKFLNRLAISSIVVFSFQVLFVNIMAPIMVLDSSFWYGNLFWIIADGIDYLP